MVAGRSGDKDAVEDGDGSADSFDEIAAGEMAVIARARSATEMDGQGGGLKFEVHFAPPWALAMTARASATFFAA